MQGRLNYSHSLSLLCSLRRKFEKPNRKTHPNPLTLTSLSISRRSRNSDSLSKIRSFAFSLRPLTRFYSESRQPLHLPPMNFSSNLSSSSSTSSHYPCCSLQELYSYFSAFFRRNLTERVVKSDMSSCVMTCAGLLCKNNKLKLIQDHLPVVANLF